MSYTFIIYLLGVIPSLDDLATGVTVASLAVAGLCGFIKLGMILDDCSYDDAPEKLTKPLKIASAVACVSALTTVAIPDEKVLNLMVATSVAETIAATPAAQGLANDTIDVLRGFMQKAKSSLEEK